MSRTQIRIAGVVGAFCLAIIGTIIAIATTNSDSTRAHTDEVAFSDPALTTNLSEATRKQVYWSLVEAEGKARNAAKRRYPLDPESHLEVGQSIIIKEVTPLMPEVSPADPVAALARIRQIPTGTRVEITDTVTKDNSPWYAVRILAPSGIEAGAGWINSVALIGQIEFDRELQFRRLSELDDRLVDSYRKEIARQFNLTDDQIWQVLDEGLDKNWPSP